MKYLCFLCACALFLAGCGSDGPPVVRVNGKLTLDGKALAGKAVRFIPEPGTPGVGAGCNTDLEGNYDLIAVRPGAVKDVLGVPPGKYRVAITEPMFPVNFNVPEPQGEGPAAAIGIPVPNQAVKSEIPARYTNPDSTPLRLVVADVGGTHDLRLTTNP